MTTHHRLIRDQILESLRERILTGRLKPGARIVELAIAREFQSSQGPVREALQRLVEEGLVTSERHRGSRVSDLVYEELKQVFEIRRALESTVAGQAVMEMTDEEIAAARSLVSEMHAAAAAGDFLGLVAKDMAFHRYVCACVHRPTLLRVWDLLAGQMQRFVVFTHPIFFPNLYEVASTHEPLILALERRDPDAAVRAFSDHMDHVWTRVEDLGGVESMKAALQASV